jgi:hypothetical protein
MVSKNTHRSILFDATTPEEVQATTLKSNATKIQRTASRLGVMVPGWFEILAWFWIAICFASALFTFIQTLRKPQKMWIMDVVRPITGLYMGRSVSSIFLLRDESHSVDAASRKSV